MTESPSRQPESSQGTDPPARAFAQGTGVLLQTVGAVLFMSTCCVCSWAGHWDPLLSRPQVHEQLREGRPLGLSLTALFDQPAKAGFMLMVSFMTVGGLALLGFGLGLQSDKPRSAWGALITAVLLTVVLVVAGLGVWSGGASWPVRLWHGLLTIVAVLVLGFCWVAFRQVRAFPPPPDGDVLPADFKIPYSVYHDDPPQVRLAKELADRRQRLEAEQRALERLERELNDDPGDS